MQESVEGINGPNAKLRKQESTFERYMYLEIDYMMGAAVIACLTDIGALL